MKFQVQEQEISLDQSQLSNKLFEIPPQNRHQSASPSQTLITPKKFLIGALVLLVFSVIVYPSKTATKLPKILWIYTHNEHQAEEMVNQIFINYYIDLSRKMHYELRLINSWTAYNWLSDEISANITKTMQRVQIDVGADELLIMAIMIEHGGIILKNLDAIFLDDFEWLQNVFAKDERQDQNWMCPSSKTGLLLSAQETKKSIDQPFSDSFIAATPQNPLLIQTFGIYRSLMTGNQSLRDQHLHFFQWKQNTKVHSSAKLLQNCLNLAIQRQKVLLNQHRPPRQEDSLCNRFNFQFSAKNNPFIDISFTPELEVLRFLTNQYHQTSITTQPKIIIKFRKDGLTILLSSFLQNQKNINSLHESSILKRLLSVDGNRQVFMDILPQRNVSLCIIFLDQMVGEEIAKSYDQLKNQKALAWQTIYFVQKQKLKDQLAKNMPFQDKKRAKFVESTSNKGRNIELAITQHCPHNSFALLLNKGERFSSNSAISQILQQVRPREIIGAFVPLQINKANLFPSKKLQRFNRLQAAIVNPNLPLLKNASNHFRLFSVQSYKFLPQFDLRDSYGNYFEDRLIFVMSMLDLIREDITKTQEFYIIRKYANKFNIPRKAVFIENVAIVTDKIDEVDLQQMRKTFTRIQVQSMHSNLENIIRYKIPFDKLLVFNEGLPFIPFTQKQSPPVIPAIIHQAWLGGSMPPAKQYLFNKTAKMYANYEMKLWTLQNITQQNFPLTYQILKNIQTFNHISPYNKFATMADILRHQALYRYGGFWKDAAMHFLKPVLDDFRKYKLALATDKTIRHRWLQGMCFFGNMKEYPPLWRITSFKNLNRMRIYNSDPMDIAGPIDFRQLIIGKEEYDPQILVLSYQTFYPAQLGQHPAGDLCTRKESDLPSEAFQVFEKGWGILKNCSEIYPFTFGLQHNRYGGSWTDAVFKRPRELIIR